MAKVTEFTSSQGVFHFEDKSLALGNQLDEELRYLSESDEEEPHEEEPHEAEPTSVPSPSPAGPAGPVKITTVGFAAKGSKYNEMMWTSVGSAEEALEIPKRLNLDIPLDVLAKIHGPITCVERRNFGWTVGDIFECTYYSVQGDTRPRREIGAAKIGPPGDYADDCQITYFKLTAPDAK